MSAVKILPCSCSSSYQDSRYGLGKRVCNKMEKERTFRCTVCGKEVTSGPAPSDKPKA